MQRNERDKRAARNGPQQQFALPSLFDPALPPLSFTPRFDDSPSSAASPPLSDRLEGFPSGDRPAFLFCLLPPHAEINEEESQPAQALLGRLRPGESQAAFVLSQALQAFLGGGMQ
jgi:hypothetical protein